MCPRPIAIAAITSLGSTACAPVGPGLEASYQATSGPVVAAGSPPPVVVASRQNVAERLLAAHNRYRAEAGVPPLQWNAALAAGAAAYGPQLARAGGLVHSPRAGRPGIGENLWSGSAGAYTPEAMVGYLAEERAQFRPGIFPAVSTTGNWLDVSHYTQIIWPTTTHVGCAVHREGARDYLICRYSPSGNRDGRRVP